MTQESPLIDYLAIGHVSKDLTKDGFTLGGSVSYSGRTALSMGMQVGILTSCSDNYDLQALEGIKIKRHPSRNTTTFENIYSEQSRTQKMLTKATNLEFNAIPDEWRSAKIVHLAPIADEVDLAMLKNFPSAFMAITPQGWLRELDDFGRVHLINWEKIKEYLPRANAVVMSAEDLQNNATAETEMAQHCCILAVTKADEGATIYWDGRRYDLSTIKAIEVDSTGAGDIFAAAFFVRLYQTKDPILAGTFANNVASASVQREGINSAPSISDINEAGFRIQQ